MLPRVAPIARRVSAIFLATVVALLAAGVGDGRAYNRYLASTTTLMSRAYDGGLPNGPSIDPYVSDDQRYAQILTFQSQATNLVRGGVAPGRWNVYFIRRRNGNPFDRGTVWKPGGTVLASRGLGGHAPNGDSFDASVDGFTSYSPRGPGYYEPHCVAFLSNASNLVRGDTNRATDAFVYSLRSHRVVRVSVGTGGRQANGTTSAVAVNGNCSEVAFVSNATNLAHGTHRHYELYVRYLGGLEPGSAAPQPRHLRGTTRLVSATAGGHPANGDSSGPRFATRTAGTIVFSSNATNLAAGTGGHAQVYERFEGRAALSLVTRNRGGQAGDGDSDEPAIQDDGSWIVFRTAAANLAGATGGHRQIVRERAGSHRFGRASRGTGGGPANADAGNPSVHDAGVYVGFDSTASNLVGGDSNGVSDVFLYLGAGRNIILRQSVGARAAELSFPSQDEAVSQFSNYDFFDSSSPFADSSFARRERWLVDPGAVDQAARANPAFRQVYLRYYGAE